MVQALERCGLRSLLQATRGGGHARLQETKWEKRSSGPPGYRVIGCQNEYRGSKRLTDAVRQLRKSPWLNVLDEFGQYRLRWLVYYQILLGDPA